MADENLDIEPIDGGDGGASPLDNGGEGAEATIKIGDKEFTPEQLTEALKKSSDYDNLLPEFTKKSQALAALLGGEKPQGEENKDTPDFLKKGWKPKTFEELGQALNQAVELGAKKAQDALASHEAKAVEVKQQVDGFVAEIKKVDKDFDDQDFFQYVQRHGFGSRVNNIDDLKSLYSMYSEANLDGKLAERRALINKAKRSGDSVSKPGSTGASLPYDANALRSKGGSIIDVAREAFGKFK